MDCACARTHGVFSQQVVFGVALAAVDGPQSAEQRPPPRQDLGRTHLHQLADRRHNLQTSAKRMCSRASHGSRNADVDRRHHLVLHVLVADLQLHDVFKGPEEGLIEVEVRELQPAGQHLRQNIVDEGDGLLGDVPLFVTRCLERPGETLKRRLRDRRSKLRTALCCM